MKMTLNEIDEQIREVENRIARERLELDDAVDGCTKGLRETVTSPKTLLALLGVGYAVGKVVFREKKTESEAAPLKKAGFLGLLTGVAGTALSMAGPRLGWGTVAKWAARRYMNGRKVTTAAGQPGHPLAVSPSSRPFPRAPTGV